MDYVLSVDLGMMSDYTAYSILEHGKTKAGNPTAPGSYARILSQDVYVPSYNLRYLDRVNGKPYTEIVMDIKKMMDSPLLSGVTDLVVDATGVGLPVVQMLSEIGLHPVAINITGGSVVNQTDRGYSVPKKDIVAALQIIFQNRRLKIAGDLLYRDEFINELKNFKLKITKAGNETFEAWRDNIHDDLVLSVGIGAWYCLYVLGTEMTAPRTYGRELKEYDPLRHGFE
jgi:hypothetical protein